MPAKAYPRLLELMSTGALNWTTDDIRMVLVTGAYTYSDSHNFLSAVTTANELVGTRSPALSSRVVNTDLAGDRVWWDCADYVYTALNAGTAAGCVIYRFNASDAAAPLLFYLDPSDLVTNGGNVTVQFAATGLISFNY